MSNWYRGRIENDIGAAPTDVRPEAARGSQFCGGGIFIDNNGNSGGNVVSFDPSAVDQLATAGTSAKAVAIDYWTR